MGLSVAQTLTGGEACRQSFNVYEAIGGGTWRHKVKGEAHR